MNHPEIPLQDQHLLFIDGHMHPYGDDAAKVHNTLDKYRDWIDDALTPNIISQPPTFPPGPDGNPSYAALPHAE